MDERTQALKTVRLALPVFQEINDLYLAATGIYQKASLFDANSSAKAQGSKGKALACAFAAWFGFELILQIVVRIFVALDFEPSAVFTVAYVIISLVSSVMVYHSVIRSTNKNIEMETQKLVTQSKHDLDLISNDIYEIYQKNSDIISPIPRDYRTYDAVCYFEHLLENGHADSMKEALILYDEYVHREGMRIDNQRLIQQNLQQRKMMAHVEQLASAASRDAKIATVFSIANFLVADRQ